jgi:hypothetical protein
MEWPTDEVNEEWPVPVGAWYYMERNAAKNRQQAK